MPQANGLRQSLSERNLGGGEGTRDWALEDMMRAEEASRPIPSPARIRRKRPVPKREKRETKEEEEEEVISAAESLLGVRVKKEEEAVVSPAKQLPTKRPVPPFAPAGEHELESPGLLPSGKHVLWVWLTSEGTRPFLFP